MKYPDRLTYLFYPLFLWFWYKAHQHLEFRSRPGRHSDQLPGHQERHFYLNRHCSRAWWNNRLRTIPRHDHGYRKSEPARYNLSLDPKWVMEPQAMSKPKNFASQRQICCYYLESKRFAIRFLYGHHRSRDHKIHQLSALDANLLDRIRVEQVLQALPGWHCHFSVSGLFHLSIFRDYWSQLRPGQRTHHLLTGPSRLKAPRYREYRHCRRPGPRYFPSRRRPYRLSL